MEINDSDKQKIGVIVACAQINCMIDILKQIDKHALVGAIANMPIEEQESFGHKMMVHALEFCKNIEREILKENEKLTHNNQ